MAASADAEGVNLAIIITPMLDMAFQILAFFVMTYHPSALEGHIDGSLLPPSKISAKGNMPKTPDQEPDVPVDEVPDVKDVMVVVVKAVPKGQRIGNLNEGQPTRLMLRKPESQDPEMIADTDTTFEQGLKKLVDTLKDYQARAVGSKTTINIEADRELKHGYFIRVYDVCKVAKFANVGFVAPPPEAAGGK